MEPQGSLHGAPATAPKDGPCKPSIPQKNAYARLVQKHHSGRFRSYLNHIAQKLQLEESTLNDSGSDTELSLKRGLVREALCKNGVKTPGGVPSKALHPSQLDLVGSEKPSENKEEGFAQRQQQQQRDPGTGKRDESCVMEEEEGSPHWPGVAADLLTASQMFCNQQGLSPRLIFQQKTSISGKREKEELWRNKHGSCDLLDGADDCLSAGQSSLDLSVVTARKACQVLPNQTHGGDKRGLARARNNSESARVPPNADRRRQLSESQADAMSNSDCRMNPRQLGTPRGVPQSASTPGDRRNRTKPTRGRKKVFEAYMSREDISAGLKRKTLIQGPLRINPKKYHEAFIPSPDGTRDIFIDGVVARNRALNGDIVVVKLLPKDQWKVIKPDGCDNETEAHRNSSGPSVLCDPGKGDASSPDLVIEAQFDSDDLENEQEGFTELQDLKLMSLGADKNGRNTETAGAHHMKQEDSSKANDPDQFLQKTAKVVFILERKHSRAATGFIRLLPDRNSELFKKCAMFSPVDHRLPRAYVALAECPPDFATRPEDYSNTLFICSIVDWREDSNFAIGRLAQSLGQAGEIEPETEGILTEYGVDFSDFPPEALQCLPPNLPWAIPPAELAKRRDLREECIFTIDPSTAKDLDDALSCKLLPDGNFEVGVHIADVSYFVVEGTALDEVASKRATSVYLVQKVIPMLPKLLCEELCSLRPMTDRLTFSVIWKLTAEGKILEEWFGRTVICSCSKFSYDHVQSMIENPEKVFAEGELPPISPRHSVDEIRQAVLSLHHIAKQLRRQRFIDGALRLDQLKLSFTLDKENGMPQGCYVYQYRDSNKQPIFAVSYKERFIYLYGKRIRGGNLLLVEEFMLLANMAVAHQIYRAFPAKAVLRRHPAPQTKMLNDLAEFCSQMGLEIDCSSAGALHKSLMEVFGEDSYAGARKEVLTNMFSRPMQMAVYFCSGMLEDKTQFRHYALNVPLYTHFTSPIRRFPDIMVHRLLSASLDSGPAPRMRMEDLQKQADHCNDRKMASKRVQELSADLFFAVFVKECGPLESEAMVMGVLSEAFDVLVLKFGVQKRIYCNALPLVGFQFQKVGKKPQLTLVWEPESYEKDAVPQVISIFALVDVILKSDNAPLKYSAVLKRPDGGE